MNLNIYFLVTYFIQFSRFTREGRNVTIIKLADFTLPSSVTMSTNDVKSSQRADSSTKPKKKKEDRYKNLPDEVKKTFVGILKATPDRTLWKELAGRIGFCEPDIKFIENNILANSGNEAYSPFEDILQIYEDRDRSVSTLFKQLGRMNMVEAIKVLKDYVPVRYHGLIEDASMNMSYEITCPDLSLLQPGIRPASPYVYASDLKAVPEVDYEELEKATDCWNKSRILGQGGFGAVFHANWKNTDVAVKRIQIYSKSLSKRDNDQLLIELRQSLNEIRSLNQCRHDNIVQIYGYSANTGKPYCLIYELLRGGTLKDKLQSSDPFPWNLRVRIMLDTARGLQFLHSFKGSGGAIIHGDIKPANILLDEHMKAKIGDFGLARESATKAGKTISQIFGTRPYLPDEFVIDRKVCPKVDSYSFGIVLFEVATRERVFDKSRVPSHLKNFVQFHMADTTKKPSLMDASEGITDTDIYIFETLLRIGLECVKQKEERAEMSMVYEKLKPLSSNVPSEQMDTEE